MYTFVSPYFYRWFKENYEISQLLEITSHPKFKKKTFLNKRYNFLLFRDIIWLLLEWHLVYKKANVDYPKKNHPDMKPA